MTFKPSPAQQAFYDWVANERGHCILTAVAGAGKTTTILNGISMMRGKVLMTVFNKKMADEIKEKLLDRKDLRARADFDNKTDRVESSTLHALGLGIVRGMTYPNRPEIDDKKVAKLVEQIILTKEATEQQIRDDLREMAPTILQFVSMAKNRGFVPPQQVKNGLTDWDNVDAWFNMAYTFDIGETLEDEQINTAIGFARTVLRASTQDISTIDMDDMIYLPLARRVNLRPWHRFNWVLIDEAQDTNPSRRALAQLVMADGARLVAVGDPHQAIYGFTGADNDSLEQIKAAMNAKELPLTVSYRCPRAVVNHARQWVDHIEAHESAPEGSVTQLDYADIVEQLRAANPSETAVLCRMNKYLVGLCFKLIREGIAAKIEGRNIGEGLIKLATRWKTIKTVNALENKLHEYRDREVAKAMAKSQEQRAERIVDEVATILVVVERVRAQGANQVTDVVAAIEEIFADGVAESGMITLCSAHKSKGLEWDKVFLLGREELMPSPFAKQDWQVQQEHNLIYVAVTRAKAHLVEVFGVREENDPTKEED